MSDSENKSIKKIEDETEATMKMVLQNRKDDYSYGRDILYTAAERLQDVLESAVVLAQESEHPRAIEVASNTATHLADIAQKLMDHQLRTEKLNNPQGNQNNVTNNNLNVKLSTKDLLELIKNDE